MPIAALVVLRSYRLSLKLAAFLDLPFEKFLFVERHVSPLSGVKQTWISAVLMSLIDPFATSARICAVVQS